MVADIERYLMQATARSVDGRAQFWKRDFSSPEAYANSVDPNRDRLRTIIGAVDKINSPVSMSYDSGPDRPALIAESESVRVFAVRWNAYGNVEGEGLLLEPKQSVKAAIIVIPDADQIPEMLAGLSKGKITPYAQSLAEAGCRVVIPVLINRQNTWSGNPKLKMTNQTHREWIWRQGIEFGRHPIGYEVRKIEAVIDWLKSESQIPVGIAGYGEGALLALYTAAVDQRIDAALVSGYFQKRDQLWSEPIYRCVFGLLREFGDAEIASLIAPRPLLIEHSSGPSVDGPPSAEKGRRLGAAPGALKPPTFDSVDQEIERARNLCTSPDGKKIGSIQLITGADDTITGPGSAKAIATLLAQLGVKAQSNKKISQLKIQRTVDSAKRQQRQVTQLVNHCQQLLRDSEKTRNEFWKKAVPKPDNSWTTKTKSYKDYLWNEILGKVPDPFLPLNPRSRILEKHDTWTTYEVMLDVWEGIYDWGYLLLPKDIKPGERRPVVVCQHGLEGLPASVINEDRTSRNWNSYRAFANQLAARGFIVYAPHNPYRGNTVFRQNQRKANPLKLTLYSFILGQHQQMLKWLGSLPFVDAKRIGFYGLSYGGTTAVRVPPLLDGYALSICSAAYNEWATKVVSLDFRAAYIFTGEYDHFYFNQSNTFNNSELIAMLAPRPFMVERGHNDGVAPDEWVAYEFAKVRRLYAKLGVPDHTEIEFFEGGHIINGKGTFDFLHRHLNWPKP